MQPQSARQPDYFTGVVSNFLFFVLFVHSLFTITQYVLREQERCHQNNKKFVANK